MRRPLSLRLGLWLALPLLLLLALGQVWTPYPPTRMDFAHRLAAPSALHWLGTDPFGRDVFSMLAVGLGQSVGLAGLAVALGLAGGLPLGLLAALGPSALDRALMRSADLVFAFPALLSAVLLTALAGPGGVNAMVAIGVFNVPVFARLVRSAARSLREMPFVLAARALGRGGLAIALRHILPNLLPLVVVQASIQLALAILAEAGLSYVGLGTQPPNPSLGRMLAEAQTYVFTAPRLALFPGLLLTATSLAFTLIGEGWRERLDPRLARRADPWTVAGGNEAGQGVSGSA